MSKACHGQNIFYLTVQEYGFKSCWVDDDNDDDGDDAKDEDSDNEVRLKQQKHSNGNCALMFNKLCCIRWDKKKSTKKNMKRFLFCHADFAASSVMR